MRCAVLVAAVCLSGTSQAQPSPFAWKSIRFPDGQVLEFRAHFPPGFDRTRPYPVAMIFVDGAQDRAAVWDTLAGHWFRQASEHGWVVVLPVAPKGGRFHEGGERLLPALIRNLRVGLTIEGNRLHAVGVGEGTKSAFRAVEGAPFEFASLTAFGDGALQEEDLRRLGRLETVRLQLFGPAKDDQPRKPTFDLLQKLAGMDIEAPWAAMPEYDDAAIWKALLDHRDQLTRPDSTTATISAAIDAWHDAAAKGDEDRYFGAFAPEGVFMGTDATERWTADALREWAAPYFARPSAWIFVPVSRNLILSPNGDVAWFDEVLGSAHYGDCRGTGVLRKIQDTWKIAHYNLTVPVPNDLLGGVVNEIRGLRAAVESGETAKEAAQPITIYLVAAESVESESGETNLTPAGRERTAALARLLGTAGLSVVIASGSMPTAETVAAAAGLEVDTVEKPAPSNLASRIRALSPGSSALVALPATLLPEFLKAVQVGDADLPVGAGPGDLIVLTIDAAGRASLQILKYFQ